MNSKQLKRIILEEIRNVLKEQQYGQSAAPTVMTGRDVASARINTPKTEKEQDYEDKIESFQYWGEQLKNNPKLYYSLKIKLQEYDKQNGTKISGTIINALDSIITGRAYDQKIIWPAAQSAYVFSSKGNSLGNIYKQHGYSFRETGK